MLIYTCSSCRRGEHQHCAGKQPPPPGMFGGKQCGCDGNCAHNVEVARRLTGKEPEPDPQLDAVFDALDKMKPKE